MQQISPNQNAIVLMVEGLGVGLVGAYGSHIARTTCLDQLAARGIVLDQCFVDSISLKTQLSSIWTARHAMQTAQTESPTTDSQSTNLFARCDSRGLPNCVITDCEIVARQAEIAGCRDVLLVEPYATETPMADSADCGLMALFAAASEELLDPARKGLVWIHSRGLKLPWDAPLEMRELFTDPEDPAPPSEVGPPCFDITSDTDPDLVIGWEQVAAAQAMVIDEGISGLVASISARDDHTSWAWLLASFGEIPLGEHGHVGWGETQLFGEQLGMIAILVPRQGLELGSPILAPHPAGETDLVRTNAHTGTHPTSMVMVGQRRGELFQLPDLSASIIDMLGLHQDADDGLWGISCFHRTHSDCTRRWDPANQLIAVDAGCQRWIRCPAWSATFSELQSPSLYVKPDDRWEVADIASRRSDIVELLQDFLAHFQKACDADATDGKSRRGQWPGLPDELVELLR